MKLHFLVRAVIGVTGSLAFGLAGQSHPIVGAPPRLPLSTFHRVGVPLLRKVTPTFAKHSPFFASQAARGGALSQTLSLYLQRGNRFALSSSTSLPTLPGTFMSSSTRAQFNVLKSIAGAGIQAGQNQTLAGGTIINGQITGTIYGTNFSNPVPYFNEGSYLGAFGNSPLNTGGPGGPGGNFITLPNVPDFLTFSPNKMPIGGGMFSGPLIHGKSIFVPSSGSERALLNQYSQLTQSSVALGIKTAPPIIGGQFIGSFLVPFPSNQAFYSSKFLFAFGNSPYNNSINTYITPSTLNYIDYAGKHGQIIVRTISGGQFTTTFYSVNSPFFAPGYNTGGSLEGIGNNQFNTGPTSQIFDLTNPASFINFF